MADPRHEVPQAVQSLPSVGAIALYLSGKDVNWWAAVLGLTEEQVDDLFALARGL